MGKKDKKDPAKAEAKKARAAAKQNKAATKRSKKEIKGGGEIDIDTIISQFAKAESTKTAVTISACGQPSPRSNFSITALPSGELLLFGGEFFDGEQTVMYGELYRWNIERDEWRCVDSLNTPPPRCSHQAAYYKEHLYVFGGEYATLDQFHHYKDMWCLDLKTNVWTEMKPSGDLPCARSGHRMLVWRGFLVLFGGFYEALRDMRFFNDVYLFSFQEERWTRVNFKSGSLQPRPRSGSQLCVYAQEDALFMCGGYSREKQLGAGAHSEGRLHDDMWSLPLRPLAGQTGPQLDTSKLQWQKVAKKGHYPTRRCGATMVVYKNKGVLFGGVRDDEGPRHSMASTFFNDLYAFDMERKRWFQLGLKRAAEGKRERRRPKAQRANEASGVADGEVEEEEEVEDEEVDEEEEDEDEAGAEGRMFGYIDESGQVMYMDVGQEDEDEDEGLLAAAAQMTLLEQPPTPAPALPETPSPAESALLSQQEPPLPPAAASEAASITPLMHQPSAAPLSVQSYFSDRADPAPRINPSLMVRGNTLFVYGGVTEIGDVEVTLDDCWTLDLSTRGSWRRVLDGTMTELVWKGEDTEMSTEGERTDDDSDGDGSEGSEDEGSEDGSGDDEEEGAAMKKKAAVKKAGEESAPARRQRGARSGTGGAGTGARGEIERLRAELGLDEGGAAGAPLSGESLRSFYARTNEHWSQQVVARWHASGGVEGALGEKELKRRGFLMAEERFNELLPHLQRLQELEAQQQTGEADRGGEERRRGPNRR